MVDFVRKKAVILGTGAPELENPRPVRTDYGEIMIGEVKLGNVWLTGVSRHAQKEHPDKVNVRGYAQALKLEGITDVLAVSATGRISYDVHPGHLVAVNDIFNYSVLSSSVQFSPTGGLMFNSEPYIDSELNGLIFNGFEVCKDDIVDLYKGTGFDLGFHGNGTYTLIEGPDFLTKREENLLRRAFAEDNCNQGIIVGMTAREAFAFKQLGIRYGLLGICTDYSSSAPAGHVRGSHEVVRENVKVVSQAAYMVLEYALNHMSDKAPFNSMLFHEDDVDVGILRNGKDSCFLSKIIENEIGTRMRVEKVSEYDNMS